MNGYREKISNYINEKKGEIVSDLKELIKIPSVSSGAYCEKVLLRIKEMYEKNGFETEYDREGGYLLSYFGKSEHSLGLFAHADVVGVSDDWTLGAPFEALEKDGAIIGRGTLDDKSGVIMSLYCMKLFKELDIPFNSRLVCFTGSNEENGMEDIQSYVKTHTPPTFSLVPDSAFPLYHGNKGIVWIGVSSDAPFELITGFCGGRSVNITLGDVTVRLKYSDALYDELKKDTSVQAERDKDEIVLRAKGISTHGALPEGSLNAGLVAIRAILSCPSFCSVKDRKILEYLTHLLSNYYGEALGIENYDTDFGRLTCTNGIIKMQDGKIYLTFDIRVGASVDIDAMSSKICSELSDRAMSVTIIRSDEAHFVSKDDPYIQKCLDVYRKYSGNKDAQAIINAGGTYARYLPCSAEIGTQYAQKKIFSLPKGHGGLHQPDEYISIDAFLRAIELCALMLIECDGEGRDE
ncbi:MAG: Sapep family Mn(2+)-dependent dipeptidase [Clostridia bacterium]|nr:Sapep family Mn(2+)-dependent dipeptidase [Clostridia bacterium]